MVEISVDADRIRFAVQGLHQLWAFKRTLEVPRSAVRAVRRLPADALRGVWKGCTHLPGVIVAGTYYKDGERHFWDVAHADRALEIELEGHRYDRLFVEVADIDAALRALAL